MFIGKMISVDNMPPRIGELLVDLNSCQFFRLQWVLDCFIVHLLVCSAPPYYTISSSMRLDVFPLPYSRYSDVALRIESRSPGMTSAPILEMRRRNAKHFGGKIRRKPNPKGAQASARQKKTGRSRSAGTRKSGFRLQSFNTPLRRKALFGEPVFLCGRTRRIGLRHFNEANS